MTTVLFVHGTGVRNPGYEETFKLIEQQLLALQPNLMVERCLWGDAYGIRKIDVALASIPRKDKKLALGEEKEDYEIVLWEQLYRDPLYELRVLSFKPGEKSAASPWGKKPGDQLKSQVESVSPSPELQAKLQEAGIAEEFAQACEAVIRSEPYNEAFQNASDPLDEYRQAVARAIIAQSMAECEQQERFPPILTDADLRDEVVKCLSRALGEETLGLGEWVGNRLWGLAQPIGTWYLMPRRGNVTYSASPMLGDILLYQSRGEGIRNCIRETIETVEPPVVLLAHSLGGIACVDLLVKQDLRDRVKLLVTVGSQAPYLYEINALHSLEFGQPLPEYFPQWLNIYDQRDFLSYIGKELFPGKVDDVPVDSRQPFPRSHSAYWTNDVTWEAIAEKLKQL